MLFDIFLLRYFSITDVAAKSIPFCENRGLVNPCKSTSLGAKKLICVNLVLYFASVVMDFTLSPNEWSSVFVMIPNEGLDRLAKTLFNLIVSLRVPHMKKTKHNLD